MSTLRTLKLIQVLLAVAITFLAIGLRQTDPAVADQQTEEQDHKMDVRGGCLFVNGPRSGPPCYRVFCRDPGTDCSKWRGACFTLDEDDEDGYCDY